MSAKQAERKEDFELEAKDKVEKPETSPDVSPKMVVFRSTDKELYLVQKAGFTDKSHGTADYIPTQGVQFVDCSFRIEDTKENKSTIEWLRRHSSYGISFREVPDINEMALLPPIVELEKMSPAELKELCVKRQIETNDDASKETMILALLKKQ